MKKLAFNYDGEEIEVILQVANYISDNSIYIGLLTEEDGEFELFDDLTVNLGNSTKENEAYISDFMSKEKLEFIKNHQLGEVLPEKGKSGFCEYNKVAFHMETVMKYAAPLMD